MKTVTVRDLRLHWPKIEQQLTHGSGELIVTRDAKPVAKLTIISAGKEPPQPRFSAALHERWMKGVWGRNPPKTDSGKWLAAGRSERRSSRA